MTESMQWTCLPNRETDAKLIVSWINSHAGVARYERGEQTWARSIEYFNPRIVITGPNGPVYAKPGDTIVMGSETFQARDQVTNGPRLRYLREFTVRSEEPTP